VPRLQNKSPPMHYNKSYATEERMPVYKSKP